MFIRIKPARLKCFVFLSIILLCWLSDSLKADNTKYLDSLENVLSKALSGNDSITALCNLCWSYSSSDPQKTIRYGKKALSMLTGKEDKRILSEVYDAVALGHWVNNDIITAKAFYKKSLHIGEKYKLDDRIAWSHYNLAQIALIENKPDTVILHTKRSCVAFRKAGMDNWMVNSYWLMLKVATGDGHELICREMITEVESCIQSTDNLSELTFRYLDLSKIYTLLDNPSKSLECVLQALEMAEKSNNEKGIITAYTSIGTYLRDIQHNPAIAIQYYERILETYRKFNSNWGISETLGELGVAYMEMQNDSMAITYFTESLKIAEELGYSYSISEAYKHLGEIQFRKADYKKALSLFERSFKTRCTDCYSLYAHPILIHIGNAYSQLGEPDKAKAFYQKSYHLADSVGDKRHIAISLTSLGDWYAIQNDAAMAISFYRKALDNASETNGLALQISISDKLGSTYPKQNDYLNAFNYQKLSDQLDDSLRHMNDNENNARVETLFEFENLRRQKEVENTRAEAEIERQVLTRNLFLAGFVIMTLLGVFLYISFRRKKKDNFRLAEQKRMIEEMSDKMHEADKLKLQFFTNISHEFRTPLTLITGVTEELVKHEKPQNTWNKQVRVIQRNAAKLLHLVNQILDIRKLDNGDSVVHLSTDDLVRFIDSIVVLFDDYAKHKRIDLKFVSEKSALHVSTDFGKLEKILNNLISNAIKFSSYNDHIRVTLYSEHKTQVQFVIEVEDSGRGIPSDHLKNVFQPFYQVTDSEGGSGIGLALVQQMVALLKGTIEIESQLNKGTRVTIKIPDQQKLNFSREDRLEEKSSSLPDMKNGKSVYLAEETITEANTTEKADEYGLLSEKTLLIVEDNTDLLDFVASILADEYKILKAPDGKRGYGMAMKHIPDIIISDIMMPGINGLEMCEQLKNNSYTSHIPILMLTAKTDQDSMLQSYRIGADDYIVKPFSAVLLKSRIQNLVNQRRKLIEKFSQQFQVEPTEILLPDTDKLFLDRIIDVIEKYIDDPELDIDFLASEMIVSRTQLYRKLKALTDYSGNQFIRIIRLKRAAQLLARKQLNIAEVMQRTGFSNYSYFNQCFKEQFQSTPKDYALKVQAGD